MQISGSPVAPGLPVTVATGEMRDRVSRMAVELLHRVNGGLVRDPARGALPRRWRPTGLACALLWCEFSKRRAMCRENG